MPTVLQLQLTFFFQVAVKIQKPEIQTQIEFDLACYRLLLYAVEKIFDLPVYWSAQYVSEHVRQETDFINEAKNSEQCQLFLNETGDYLKNQVHVPIVYWDKTTKRVMTAEWIEGMMKSPLYSTLFSSS